MCCNWMAKTYGCLTIPTWSFNDAKISSRSRCSSSLGYQRWSSSHLGSTISRPTKSRWIQWSDRCQSQRTHQQISNQRIAYWRWIRMKYANSVYRVDYHYLLITIKRVNLSVFLNVNSISYLISLYFKKHLIPVFSLPFGSRFGWIWLIWQITSQKCNLAKYHVFIDKYILTWISVPFRSLL